MRMLVLGAGALGGYFGARLLQGGADITFLVRPRRAAQLAEHGLVVRSSTGEIHCSPKTLLQGQISGTFDFIVLTCKAYDLPSAMAAIAPAMGPGSIVLPLLNGVQHIELLEERFGTRRVFGGTTSVAAALGEDGEIRRLPVPFDKTTFGDLSGAPSSRCDELQQAFSAAEIPTVISPRILADMWRKFFVFACSAAISTLMRAKAGAIAGAPSGGKLVSAAMAECRCVMAAEGFPPPVQAEEVLHGLFSQPGSTYCPSMLRDMERGGPTEGDHVIGDLVRRAARHDLDVPILRAALCNLEIHERSGKDADGLRAE